MRHIPDDQVGGTGKIADATAEPLESRTRLSESPPARLPGPFTEGRHPENADNHPNTIVQQDGWRVVPECGGAGQWIVQKYNGKRGWQGKSFCRTRRALIRDFNRRSRGITPENEAILSALPERFTDENRGWFVDMRRIEEMKDD